MQFLTLFQMGIVAYLGKIWIFFSSKKKIDAPLWFLKVSHMYSLVCTETSSVREGVGTRGWKKTTALLGLDKRRRHSLEFLCIHFFTVISPRRRRGVVIYCARVYISRDHDYICMRKFAILKKKTCKKKPPPAAKFDSMTFSLPTFAKVW